MDFSMNQLGSMMGTVIFICTFIQKCVPEGVWSCFETWHNKLTSFLFPYIEIAFHERTGDSFGVRSKAYTAIETYLENNSSQRAMRLKAAPVKGRRTLALSMDDYEDIIDVYQGIKVTWTLMKRLPSSQIITTGGSGYGEKRYYLLSFHRKHRKKITEDYLEYVLEQGKAIEKKNRILKLYTNCGGNDESSWENNSLWSYVLFEHPATFDTLAMEPSKKKEIMNDLIAFTRAKKYYNKIGKTWKRGYLLYGPPGTGKSTMIAAMANLLQYDVYDLELTSVDDNMELRRLLIETGKKSIIVIEDIDCSLNLTGKRAQQTVKKDGEDKDKKEREDIVNKKETKDEKGKVTLSGLLNFIDGLWSSCGSERIIVFTTNHVDKLDPALIRRGRMDKHIEFSNCCFEAFKVLAKNYLDLESHDLFPKIESLLQETKITPADVAENLMRKSPEDEEETCELSEKEKEDDEKKKREAETCLQNLIKALETAKKQQEQEAAAAKEQPEQEGAGEQQEEEEAGEEKEEEEQKEEEDSSSSTSEDESKEQ